MVVPESSSSASSAWVVEAWRQRGLISGDAVISKEQLAEFHTANSNSWFARRNRHSPHCHSMTFDENASWLARRNRQPPPRLPGATEKGGFSSWVRDAKGQQPGALEAWVRGRLLWPDSASPLRLKKNRSNEEPISPSVSQSDLPSVASSTDSLGASLPGVPVRRLEPTEDVNAPRPVVELTLYDLCSCIQAPAHRLGVGVYHSGIVIEARAPALHAQTARLLVSLPPRTPTALSALRSALHSALRSAAKRSPSACSPCLCVRPWMAGSRVHVRQRRPHGRVVRQRRRLGRHCPRTVSHRPRTAEAAPLPTTRRSRHVSSERHKQPQAAACPRVALAL